MSPGNIYRYFRNKERLLDAVRGHAFDRLADFMQGKGVAASIPLRDRYLRFMKLSFASKTPLEVAQMYQPLAAGGYSAPLRAVTAVLTSLRDCRL